MPTAREDTTRLAELLRREHHALAEFLVALAAFDRERRWVDLGYKSLFYFLTRELELPKGPAYYRMTAAELLQKYPEIIEPLRDGRLNLSTIVEVASVITPENRAEVLPRFFGTSKREAKEVVAEILPVTAPPLRTVVTAVRAPEAAAVAPAPVSEDVHQRCGSSEEPGPCQLAVPDVAPPPATRPERSRVEPLTAELSRFHVTVTRRLLEKLAAARDALSHSHPGASDDQVLEVGLDLVIERHRKRRGIGAKPRKPSKAAGAPTIAASAPSPRPSPPASLGAREGGGALRSERSGIVPASASIPASSRAREGGGALSPEQAPRLALSAPVPPPAPATAREGERPLRSERSRYVPADVSRAVWERDQGRCVWPLENGGICASTHQVEIDHILGLALGAGTTVDECRLLCRFHQDVSARRLYGDDLMNAFTRPKGPRCSEPVAEYAAIM